MLTIEGLQDMDENIFNNLPGTGALSTLKIDSISNAMQTSSSNPHVFPSDPHDEISASHPQVIVLEPEELAGLDPGSTALQTDHEKSVTVQRVDDLTQPIPCEDEHNRATAAVL